MRARFITRLDVPSLLCCSFHAWRFRPSTQRLFDAIYMKLSLYIWPMTREMGEDDETAYQHAQKHVTPRLTPHFCLGLERLLFYADPRCLVRAWGDNARDCTQVTTGLGVSNRSRRVVEERKRWRGGGGQQHWRK